MTLTNWGYSITELGAMLTDDEFNEMTAGRYQGDERIAPLINAATAAVRNYCGWHVAPSEQCELSARAHDLRMTYVGCDTIIQLPARYVSAVESVKVSGNEVTDYSFEPHGLLRIYDCLICSRKAVIEVSYTAGLTEELAGAVKELVGHQVTHGLAQSYGVQSEAAGGVSVTYSASWINSAKATALPDDNRDTLAPYRLQGVF